MPQRRLRELGPKAVLLKGGHMAGEDSVDVLDDGDEPLTLVAPRVATANTHGTGCTLSAAIAALLARGLPLREAVREAKAYVTGAIRAADRLSVGHGHGPVHHFHASVAARRADEFLERRPGSASRRCTARSSICRSTGSSRPARSRASASSSTCCRTRIT